MPFVLRRELRECGFSFLSDSEVRELSAQRIISPIAFDQFRNPLRGGLYDSALGPIDPNAVCPTCSLNYKDCPGHIGHIELCAPVYNPLLFSQLYMLLQVKCFTCHRLRLSRPRLHEHLCRLLLLERGHTEDALNFDKKVEILSNGNRDDRERCVAEWKEELLQEPRRVKLVSHVRSMRKTFVRSLFAAAQSVKRCENCGANGGRIRHVGYTKFFIKAGDSGDDFADGEDAFRGFDDDEVAKEEPSSSGGENYLAQMDVYEHVRKLWENDFEAMVQLYGASFKTKVERREGWGIFFKTCISVPPNRFRPPQLLAGSFTEHPHNELLQNILNANETLKRSINVGKEDEDTEMKTEDGEQKGDVSESLQRQEIDVGRVLTNWVALQKAINVYVDSSRDDSAARNPINGVRQLLEKKEGLFRKHMMGKRVNHACRSVISPDPYIGTTEIGIPQRFATTLVYPERVTPWNVAWLRRLVEKGGSQHPGANYVEMAKGRRTDLRRMTEEQRYALAARLLSDPGQTVYRHLVSGDVMLVNRQPTLHKPGIMAHKVRVLSDPKQQTIRMHYANCNTYNADFDGDEINCHLPQDELSRAEAYFIASANEQYIVPTDGSPLRGLIQDHVDAGVKLCVRDTFFEREEFYQLMHAATSGLPGIQVCSPGVRLSVPQPAILKPTPLWTGKQIFSMLIHIIAGGRPLMSFDGKSKMPADALGKGEKEHLVLVRRGDLLRGVLDKGSFGSANYGLVHGIQELYGSDSAGKFLNGLARLLTYYLQFLGGHTCSIEDMWLSSEADQSRRRIIDASGELGRKAMRDLVLKEGGGDIQQLQKEADALCGDSEAEDDGLIAKHHILRSQVEAFIRENPGVRGAKIDSHMIAALAPVNSDLLKACLPNLYVPFPVNSFALMVMTGAKGSKVNLSQISCALGQQSLEGRRVPFMSSGKTLPAFRIYEAAPRAGGFVADRFLTGVRPAEYYFHCMAGREGLVDTAVKTSRSGYLQRCLIKFMEELQVSYDHTVRDAEGSVVQFLYGEDGIDPVQASYLSSEESRLDFMYKNRDVYVKKFGLERADTITKIGARDTAEKIGAYAERFSRGREALENPEANLAVGAFVLTRKLKDRRTDWAIGSIQEGWFAAEVVRVHRPKEGHPRARYNVRILSDNLIIRKVPEVIKLPDGRSLRVLKRALPDPLLSTANGCPEFGYISEKLAESLDNFRKESGSGDDDARHNAVKLLLQLKYLRSLANPGEAVGSIAGQSVGEPSTQMTLNTFHLAGHGGANVTLGIPRLREIIMTAAKVPKTPLLKIPVLPGVARAQAESVASQMSRLYVEEILHHVDGIQVTETIALDGRWMRVYNVRLRFEALEDIKRILHLSFEDILSSVRDKFLPNLLAVIKRDLSGRGAGSTIVVGKFKASDSEDVSREDEAAHDNDKAGDDEDADDDEEDEGEDENGASGEAAEEGDVHDDEDGEEANIDQSFEYDSEDDHRPISEILKTPRKTDVPVPRSQEKEARTTSPAVKTPRKTEFSELRSDEKEATVGFSLSLDASSPRLLLENIIQDIAKTVTIRSTPGIERAAVLDTSKDTSFRRRYEYAVQTEGSNISKVLGSFSNVLNYDDLECNDIARILEIYGIEACRAAISKEITNVFGVYGISVDPRHLSLIADAMTFTGEYTPMNRNGIAKSSSPYVQMSFETPTQFLLDAALNGLKDNLSSPSGAIVLGRIPRLGTGMMSIMQPALL